MSKQSKEWIDLDNKFVEEARKKLKEKVLTEIIDRMVDQGVIPPYEELKFDDKIPVLSIEQHSLPVYGVPRINSVLASLADINKICQKLGVPHKVLTGEPMTTPAKCKDCGFIGTMPTTFVTYHHRPDNNDLCNAGKGENWEEIKTDERGCRYIAEEIERKILGEEPSPSMVEAGRRWAENLEAEVIKSFAGDTKPYSIGEVTVEKVLKMQDEARPHLIPFVNPNQKQGYVTINPENWPAPEVFEDQKKDEDEPKKINFREFL